MKDNINRRYIVTSVLLIFLAGEYSWAQKAKRLVPETTVKKKLLKGHKIARDWQQLSIIRIIPAEDETRFSWGNPSDLALSESGGEWKFPSNYGATKTGAGRVRSSVAD